MRPELPTAVAVDNSASIQPARSIFISWGKSVQISGATSKIRFLNCSRTITGLGFFRVLQGKESSLRLTSANADRVIVQKPDADLGSNYCVNL